MKKYVNILDFALLYLYGPWDLKKFRFLALYVGLRTWKNCTPQFPSELWDLEKFQALPLYRLWDLKALRLGKILCPSSRLSLLALEKFGANAQHSAPELPPGL